MAKTIDKIFLGILVIVLVGMSGVLITAYNTSDTPQAIVTKTTQKEITLDEAKSIALEAVPGTLREVEVEKDGNDYLYEVKIASSNSVKEVVIDMRGKIIKINTEEVDVPITGTPLEMASAAALAHIGEGRITDSEIGDEEGYYEIEITLPNGDEVDVHLDENYHVLSTEYD
jgi:uncharacterized membrane protein YkoI